MDFEPWWEEKDLGAPPPPEVMQSRARRRLERLNRKYPKPEDPLPDRYLEMVKAARLEW